MDPNQKIKKILKRIALILVLGFVVLFIIMLLAEVGFFNSRTIFYDQMAWLKEKQKEALDLKPIIPPLDKIDYDQRMTRLANYPPDPGPAVEDPNQPLLPLEPKSANGTADKPWPAQTGYPNDGAILPFKRVIAYYGNLYSKNMGVLGEYPEAEMLERLKTEVAKWETADPTTPVQPALHYIAVTAQLAAGEDGKYRARMPMDQVEKVLTMAEKINAIVFLDVQVGFSTLQEELPKLEKYLKLPQVHLGIDPEFSMKSGIRPGKIVGTYDAVDVNYAIEFLARIVRENNLTPKILVVHRYTQKMVTNYQNIRSLPEVQIVMHMDGWGEEARKINTYKQFIFSEPVQFTGFKIFYKNDTFTPGTTTMTPERILQLIPRPIYIQYQ